MAAETNGGRSSLGDQFRTARDEAMGMRDELSGLAAEMRRLFQMEAELAQAEVQEAKGHATKGAAFGAIAGLIAVIMLVFLFLTIMFAIDTALPLWAAALITTGIAGLIAALFGLMAKMQIRSFSPVPKRAIRTMQEDIQWAKSQMRSSAR